MDHAASEYLYPAGVLAEGATLAPTEVARYVHLRTRLGEGEVGGSQADLRLGPKHLVGEVEKNLAQVSKGHVLINIECLHLVEEAVCPR